MEDSSLTLSIDLHYFMDDKECHEMDATVHNKCEANLLQVLNHLGEVFDENIQIDISALEEGGVIDKLKIKFESSAVKEMFFILYGALISHFIGIAPSLDETQKQQNRAETSIKRDPKKFVFFGSLGAVHKGLDLLLEVFSRMTTDCKLYVCSGYEKEEDFCKLYHKELYETP